MAGIPARRVWWCALIAALAWPAPQPLHGADRPETIRAVRVGAALTSSDAPRRVVSSALDAGFNTIFIPIPLDESLRAPDAAAIDALIAEARQRGLRVHAVVSVMRAAAPGELPSPRLHVIYRHSEWLMVPRELAVEMLDVDPRGPDYVGRLARWTRAHPERAGGLHLSPLLPAVADYVTAEVARIAAAHALDGVHFEGIRFPGDDFDYSRGALEAFRTAILPALSAEERARIDGVARIDPFGYASELPDEWRRFRIARLTALVTRLSSAVRAARPDAIVSAGIVSGAERALVNHLQDWRTWLDNRFVDALSDSAVAGATLLSSYDTLLDGVPAAASH